MKTFQANFLTKEGVVLSENNQLQEFYDTIVKKEEDVLIQVDDQTCLMIGSPLATKIKNGEFQLVASNKKNQGEKE